MLSDTARLPDPCILGSPRPLQSLRAVEYHTVSGLALPLDNALLHGLSGLGGLSLGVSLGCNKMCTEATTSGCRKPHIGGIYASSGA